MFDIESNIRWSENSQFEKYIIDSNIINFLTLNLLNNVSTLKNILDSDYVRINSVFYGEAM